MKRDRWLIAAFAVAYAFALVPIWWPRFLPLLDQPNHLALATIWHRLHDPSWHYDEFYRLNTVPVPYWGYYFPVHLLAYLFPVEVANKIYLSLYALSVPASMWALARTYNRDPWLALLSFPFIFSYSWGFGFLQFCAGIPMAIFSLVVLEHYLRRPSAARLIGLLACVMLTFLTHVVPWMLFGIYAIPVLLSHWQDTRRVLAAAATLLMSVVLGVLDFHYASSNKMVVSGKLELSGRFEHARDLILRAPFRILTEWPGPSAQLLVGLFFAALLLLWIAAYKAPERRRALGHFIPECAAIISFVAYFVCPLSFWKPLNYWNIGPRFMEPAALFLIVCAPGRVDAWRRWLAVPAVALAIAFPLVLNAHYLSFNQRAAGMARVMDRVPRGASTMTLILEGGDADIARDHVPFIEFHSWAQIMKGGYNPFQLMLGFPIQPIPGRALPAPFWARPQDFDQGTMGYRYDYVLTYRERFDGQLFNSYASRVPLVAKDGDWRLYASKGIR